MFVFFMTYPFLELLFQMAVCLQDLQLVKQQDLVGQLLCHAGLLVLSEIEVHLLL